MGPEDEWKVQARRNREGALEGMGADSLRADQLSRALRPRHIRFTDGRLQREAGLTTEEPSLERWLRSLA